MQGTEAITQAIQQGDLEQVQSLVRQQPELIRHTAGPGIPVSLLAAYYRQWPIFDWIMTKIPDPSIYEAAAAGMDSKVKKLLEKEPDLVNAFASDGFTPLGLACYFDRPGVAQELIRRGADVNLAANNGSKVAPLHSAVAANSLDITRLLLEKGAQVNAGQNGGVTALHSAAHRGNAEMVTLLLQHGADPALQTDDGQSALDFAAADGHDEVLRLLT